jgi:hypothetical protein
MPRIRTVKPEFCTSEQVAECSPTARLLFILMWCHCDDAGRHPASVKRLKMECFPADPISDASMKELIGELISADLIIEYEHLSKRFWQVTGWHHQKIDKPSYRYGPLDKAGIPIPVGDMSTSGRRHVVDDHPPEPTGSLREPISAAADAVAARIKLLDFDEVVRYANKLRKACRSLSPEFVWQSCVIAEAINPGMIGDIITKCSTNEIRKPKGYIDSALRGECDRLGFDWKLLIDFVPKPKLGPAAEVEKAVAV